MVAESQRSRSRESYVHEQVLRTVQQRLEGCQYGFMFRKIEAEYEDGKLVLSGCVPSFYLKQNLQELLRDIPHVHQVVSDVDVVSSCGVSSVR
ncbi:BON domain-containing protein [Blastopirellula marina]|uniref:BON domain-containing protein n=1 Tax=Blastopirellula marina TaxID=124 RepID=A0A2S8GHJ9_9BACT|nr:BON domain-containing protein [Blastopirellula marina]PQO43925.1 hypothetical protein C5Y93_22340 [Blastopirellula marina]